MSTTSAGRVVLTFDVDDKGVVQGLGRVTGEVDKGTKSISTKAVAMGTAIGTAAGKLAVEALQYLGREFMAIATRGVELAPVVTSFQNLTASIGQSGDAMLSVTRGASKGLISDLDLMSAANKAILLGLPVTSESMGTMAQAAVALGKAMRQDATKSFDDLITALGRSSPMILDNLGLSVKVGEANETYARSVGKTAEQLTDAEKKLAFYNAAMDAAKRKVDEVGGIQLTLADRIQIAKNQFANFTDALGVAVATSPVINTAFDHIGQALGEAVGESQTTRVQQLIGVVNTLAIQAASVAQVLVTGADLVVRAWYGIRFVLDLALLGVMLVAEGASKAFLAIVDGANKIPGVRGQFDGLVATLRDTSAVAEGMRQSFVDQADEAWEGVKGNSALGETLAALRGTIDRTKAAMVAASQTQADSAEIARHLVGAQEEQTQSAADQKKAADALKKSLEEERDTLRSLGLVLQRDVTAQMGMFERALNRAEAEGVPLTVAISAMIPKLVELIAKAKASGLAVDGLERELALARATVQELNGGIPQLTTKILPLSAAMDALGDDTRVVTAEQMRARTESALLARAYETLGVETQRSLNAAAEAARIAYRDILASGQATAEDLKRARKAVEDAEIEAGQRTVSLWQTQIEPAIKQVGQNILGSLSANFTDMLTGTVGFKEGFLNIWEDLKSTMKNLLNTMLQMFLNEFLGGMLEGLSGWARQAGQILGGVFSMGQAGMSGMLSPSVLTAPGGVAGGGLTLGGIAAGAGLGVAAGAASYALGTMATEWAQSFFGPHFISPEAQAEADRLEAIRMAEYTGAAARAGMTPEEFVASGGVPGFIGGGEVFAGAGMDAQLHGHEAIFPLPDGFDLASSLRALERVDHAGPGGADGLVDRLGARFETALQDLKWSLPMALRAAMRPA